MKVVMITKYFYPHVGGVERHVLSVSRELVKRDIEVKIITLNFNKSLPSYERLHKMEIFRFSYPNIKFLGLLVIWLKLFFKYFSLIRGSDLVHIHDVFIWYLPLRFVFLSKLVFITFHGYPSYPLTWRIIFYQKLAGKLTYGSIAIGRFIKKWFGVGSGIVTYGAVDDEFLNNSGKERGKKSYDIVFLGRLEVENGGLFFLELVEYLRKRNFYPRVLAIGGGSLEGRFREANVPYVGFVYDVKKFIDSASVVFASGYLSILEGLARKKLVVSSFSNPLRKDYLKMTPFAKWIFVSDSKEFLAEKIEKYIASPSSANHLINDAYRWVKKQTWSKMADDYERLWKLG